MSNRLLRSCLWTGAVLSALALADRATAKPPDLPIDPNHTVTPDFLPDSDWESPLAPAEDKSSSPKPNAAPPWKVGSGTYVNALAVFQIYDCDDSYYWSSWVRSVVSGWDQSESDLPPKLPPLPKNSNGWQIFNVYEMPLACRPIPLQMIAEMPATQRQNFASTMLYSIHPLLALMPTEDLVDMPRDHPAGQVVLYSTRERVVEGSDGEIYEHDRCRGFQDCGGSITAALNSVVAAIPTAFIGYWHPNAIPLPLSCRHILRPIGTELSATQRQHFATSLLLGVHPLLALMPTEDLVDMPCDHPPVVVQTDSEPQASQKVEVAPVHGTIEIGIGFSVSGKPTYKFEVTEFQPDGTGRKEEGFRACIDALLRALKSGDDLFDDSDEIPLCGGYMPSGGIQ